MLSAPVLWLMTTDPRLRLRRFFYLGGAVFLLFCFAEVLPPCVCLNHC
jgi:hypothetical protein